jgi:Domain of unknown function (DUF4296)
MKKVITILFLFLLILQSCSDDPTRFKKGRVIPEPKFVNILIDIHLTDVVTNGYEFYQKFETTDSIDMYSNIFQKHGVSKAEFDTTVAIYSRQPELYLEVYDKVMLELNLRIDKIEKEIEESRIQELQSPKLTDQELNKQ